MMISPKVRLLLAKVAMLFPGFDSETTIRHHAEQISRQYVDGYFDGPRTVSGASRSVSMWDDVVFKAHIRQSCQDNRREWDFYNGCTDELKTMCAKPLYISKNGRVIVMERVKSTIGSWFPDYQDCLAALREFNNKLVELIDAMNGTDDYLISGASLCSDNHASNVGVTSDGVYKWIDYAGC